MGHTTQLGIRFDNDAMLSLPSSRRFFAELAAQPVPADQPLLYADQPWQVMLTVIGGSHPPVCYELRGDVVMGSGVDEACDIDLSAWNGYNYGVSRRHLIIRPGPQKLFVVDLDSTNGTHINGLPLGVGWAQPLKDGDLLSLGQMHLRVDIVQTP